MKYSPGYWRITPLFRAVLEVLAERPEGLGESTLAEILKKNYGLEFTKPDLYKALMKLELQGIIQVEQVAKELHVRLAPNYTKYVRQAGTE